jgi:aconitate hydratase
MHSGGTLAAMTTTHQNDPFGARASLQTADGPVTIYRLDALSRAGAIGDIAHLPHTIKILIEAALRQVDGFTITGDDVARVAGWSHRAGAEAREVPFIPARVVLQDLTGVPCVVDLAAMRDAVRRLGGDPRKINPLVPVDLVIDHSVHVDFAGSPLAFLRNAELEFERNRERYKFLRWGQQAFDNFRVVPPQTGIVHQVNLEYLAKVVMTKPTGGEMVAFPDSLVGTDSHTTMINGLGILGWGVGGIEAEAAMLGQPLYMVMPEVVGMRLTGHLREGVTATDLTLTITQILRAWGVVDKFVEFCGPGLDSMSLADRATIANMAPEYGATCGFFPIDAETLRYLARTGRGDAADLVERFAKEQGLFRNPGDADPHFTDLLHLDLSTIEPSLAGPKRPEDRVPVASMKKAFTDALSAPVGPSGFGLKPEQLGATATITNGTTATVGHGAVVIAAITSCTNTSNPSVMIGAGLLAQKAVARGLRSKPYVKTSLAPGSKVVTQYLAQAGVQDALDTLGFQVVGYGCTTCIGNSGPIAAEVATAIQEQNLVAAAVLSGNRNFEGRIHPLTRAHYLASPPLVVAYALAGRADIDFDHEAIGHDDHGHGVYLRDIWPTQAEVSDAITSSITPEMFANGYGDVFDGTAEWREVPVTPGDLFAWDPESTYIHQPPFFETLDLHAEPRIPGAIHGARSLVIVGDSVTTDHISPAGDIAENSPAGRFLKERGIVKKDFNSYGSRRGNDLVMVRGTFANVRLKNVIVAPKEGSFTRHFPGGEEMTIYDASAQYQAEGTPLVVIAGKDYGKGSSRDWAAKGVLLLGVKAVIAESYERIHRSNLVGMGVLPLQFQGGQGAGTLDLNGTETYDVHIPADLHPHQDVGVTIHRADGTTTEIVTTARCDTPVDVRYLANGGILQTVIRNLVG